MSHQLACGCFCCLHTGCKTGEDDGCHTWSCIVAPGEVSPGHMTSAPASTNLMAPVSTLSFFIMSGNLWISLNVGHHGPSLVVKKVGSPCDMTI